MILPGSGGVVALLNVGKIPIMLRAFTKDWDEMIFPDRQNQKLWSPLIMYDTNEE